MIRYDSLWNNCKIKSDKVKEVDSIIHNIIENRKRYEEVAKDVKVSWFFVAILHQMESSGNFTRHLHNGDFLDARTINVPKGYPKEGKPPFSWEFSAKDALTLDNAKNWKYDTVNDLLYNFESYNGFGYRIKGISSPYLWSYSNQYDKGKFVKDGKFDMNSVSKQCGAAVLLKRMLETGLIKIGG